MTVEQWCGRESEFTNRVGALFVGSAALLLACVQTVRPLQLVWTGWALLAWYTIIEAAEVLAVFFGAIWFILARRTDRIALAADPGFWVSCHGCRWTDGCAPEKSGLHSLAPCCCSLAPRFV